MKCDKFLVEELNNSGYEIDYKKLREIYTKSRQNPVCIRRKKRNEAEKAWLQRCWEKEFG